MLKNLDIRQGFFIFVSMDEELVRPIGKVKEKKFKENFDSIFDEYKQKAINMGYSGQLKFKKEHGYIIIFVII